MPETASATSFVFSRPLGLVAAAAGIVLAATLALWAHYGTAVVYEVIVAGIAACLGGLLEADALRDERAPPPHSADPRGLWRGRGGVLRRGTVRCAAPLIPA